MNSKDPAIYKLLLWSMFSLSLDKYVVCPDVDAR